MTSTASDEKKESKFQGYKGTANTVYLKAPLDSGYPGPEHFETRSNELDIKPDDLKEGEILLKVMCMSADPYLRGGIKSKSAARPDGTGPDGKAMSGFVAGQVLASKSDKWDEGDYIGASLPFTTVQVVSAPLLGGTMAWKLTDVVTEETITLGIGTLGMPGATAYGGLLDVLRPNEGETIFVSSAAGAVGSLVGQIAKNVYKCNVIGSCGGPAKNKLIKEKFGFDHAIDYKALKAAEGEDKQAGLSDLISQIKQGSADGIDMYFENVGGIHFDAAMATLKRFGRVAVCGCIPGYNEGVAPKNFVNIGQLIYSFQRIEGFMCQPWLSGKKGNFLTDMKKWIDEGHVKSEQTFFEGVSQWPVAFNSLFTNTERKVGKVVIRMQAGDWGVDQLTK